MAATAYVHSTAVLIGHVVVEDGVFIGPHAVLRADEPGADGAIQPIVVAHHANIQDGVIIHTLGGSTVRIGPRSSIAHGAIVHGPCEIGERCFVGFSSVLFHTRLEDDAVVLHRALVENVTVGQGLFVPSAGVVQTESDLQQLVPAPPEIVAFAEKVSRTNNWLTQTRTSMG